MMVMLMEDDRTCESSVMGLRSGLCGATHVPLQQTGRSIFLWRCFCMQEPMSCRKRENKARSKAIQQQQQQQQQSEQGVRQT